MLDLFLLGLLILGRLHLQVVLPEFVALLALRKLFIRHLLPQSSIRYINAAVGSLVVEKLLLATV